jgi:hypothetical protein
MGLLSCHTSYNLSLNNELKLYNCDGIKIEKLIVEDSIGNTWMLSKKASSTIINLKDSLIYIGNTYPLFVTNMEYKLYVGGAPSPNLIVFELDSFLNIIKLDGVVFCE